MSIREDISFILSNYRQAKASLELLRTVRAKFLSLQGKIGNLSVVQKHKNIILTFGTGIGAPADVPWLALLDNRETNTTRKGVYCVYLFSADMSGVYLTLNQGVGASASEAPTRERMIEVQEIASLLQIRMQWLKEKGFNVDKNIALFAHSITGKAYEKSTIAYKFYPKSNLPNDPEIEADLHVLMNAYDEYLANKPEIIPAGIRQSSVSENHRLDINTDELTLTKDAEEFIKKFKSDPANKEWLQRKILAFNKWREIFSPKNIDNLPQEQFQSFLVISENQSWDGIQRQPSIYEDIGKLRRTIKYLVEGLDEATLDQIKERVDNVLEEDGFYRIKGLGKAVTTAIIHVSDTKNRFGVWNSKVKTAMKKLMLLTQEPEGTKGEQYLAYNRLLNLLGRKYNLNLYQVDMLMHLVAINYNPIQVQVNNPNVMRIEDKNLILPVQIDLKDAIGNIQETLLIDESTIRQIIIHLIAGKNIILSGPTGTGKTNLAMILPKLVWASIGGYQPLVYTATGDWTTQDVIGGIQPKLDSDNKVTYRIHKGCVYESLSRNWTYENGAFKRCRYSTAEGTFQGVWLVIDEFNRANIDRAFGEMFTAIEYRFLNVPTMKAEHAYDVLPIPKDFRIIGTLNTFDKHYLFKLSDALKRRFAFVEILPPSRELAEKEKYYALKRSFEFLKDTIPEAKLKTIQLDNVNKIILKTTDTPRINKTFDDAYDILSFTRLSKNIGTASLVSIYNYLITDNQTVDADYDRSLDEALQSSLVPQLENVPRWSVETIREFGCGDLTSFLKAKKPDDFAFTKYANEFGKLLTYLKKDEVQRRINAFSENRIAEGDWGSYNPWVDKVRPNLPKFRQALDDLIKELEVI